MISINVDDAYAFDYYSILYIKYINGAANGQVLRETENQISEQIGKKKFSNIMLSDEYQNLLNANKVTFDAVDRAKTDQVLASYVDLCNYNRMKAKKALQEKFFPSSLTETKIGYEIHE